MLKKEELYKEVSIKSQINIIDNKKINKKLLLILNLSFGAAILSYLIFNSTQNHTNIYHKTKVLGVSYIPEYHQDAERDTLNSVLNNNKIYYTIENGYENVTIVSKHDKSISDKDEYQDATVVANGQNIYDKDEYQDATIVSERLTIYDKDEYQDATVVKHSI